MRRRRKGDRAESPRPPPPEGGGPEPRRDPPLSPDPPYDLQATGEPAPRPPEAGRCSPLLRAGPRRQGGRPEQGPPPHPSCLLKGATQTAPEDSKRARTRVVWGPPPPWPERRQGNPLCCLPREARGTGSGRPTGPPGRTVGENGAQAAPTAPHPPALQPTPQGAQRPKPGRGETGPDPPPPPSKPNGARDWGRTRGEHGPRGRALPAPGTGTARGARATPTRDGGSADAAGGRGHTHTKGTQGNTRRATGLSPRNAQTAWNGVRAPHTRLLRLLSNTLTGEWQNGDAGEGRASEPCEPGELRHQAGGAS